MTKHATCRCGAIVPPDAEMCEPCGMRLTIIRQTASIATMKQTLANYEAQLMAADIELNQLRAGVR